MVIEFFSAEALHFFTNSRAVLESYMTTKPSPKNRGSRSPLSHAPLRETSSRRNDVLSPEYPMPMYAMIPLSRPAMPDPAATVLKLINSTSISKTHRNLKEVRRPAADRVGRKLQKFVAAIRWMYFETCFSCGAVAQLGERDVRNVEARGSIPLSSTIHFIHAEWGPVVKCLSFSIKSVPESA